MRFTECETLELKSIVVNDIKKTIIAFANTNGGKLYIGVEDDGTIIGVANPDEVLMQVNSMVRDSIKPDVTTVVHCLEEKIDGMCVIAVTVQCGTERPYYLAGKGLRPEGVFVRHGAASVPATDTAIRRMIKETDGESFEDLCSLNQELTFEAAKHEFQEHGIDFGKTQRKTLRLMMNQSNVYSNLGTLISDQCVHSIKVAIFQDEQMEVFKDRREFGGSVFRQFAEVYEFIGIHNRIRATFDKLRRIDSRDYPEASVREALLNAVVHRDYAMSGSILIKMFPSRMEFISIGGLINGIEVADIMSGVSACRNPHLAAVFYRLELIEAYGTGMQKILNAYLGSNELPKIEVTPNVFKTVLPNANFEYTNTPHTEKISSAEELVMERISRKGSITRGDIEAIMGLPQTSAGRLLKRLTDNGLLQKNGNGKNTRYIKS